MDRRYYSKWHFERLRGADDSAAAAAERIRYRRISGQAVREREERFPTLTPENFAEAMEWQVNRIRELCGCTR